MGDHDALEKTAIGIFITGVFVVLVLIGLGCWGFVQLIQWVTSK